MLPICPPLSTDMIEFGFCGDVTALSAKMDNKNRKHKIAMELKANIANLNYVVLFILLKKKLHFF